MPDPHSLPPAQIADTDVSATCGNCGKKQTLADATVQEQPTGTSYRCSCGTEIAGLDLDGKGGAEVRSPYGLDITVN